MKYLKLFENFMGSELEEDLKWIMVNFLDDKWQFQLKQSVHDKLFVYEISGYEVGRIDVLRDLLDDLDGRLEFHITEGEIGIGFGEYINLYKTIIKCHIKNWIINDDLSIDVDGSVNLSKRGLIKIPINFNKVSDDFDCGNNQLTSLEGAPKSVGDCFYCQSNKLTSLEGAPHYVDGSFYCNNNKLTTLEGAPNEVGKDFNCWSNQLTSLIGSPKSVGRDFDCGHNLLTSLEGSPKSVGGNFECCVNKLTSLEGAPKSVDGNFDCSNNKLTSIEGLPKEIGGMIYCDDDIKHLIQKNYKIGS